MPCLPIEAVSEMGNPLSVPEAETDEIVKAAMFSAMGICDDYKAEIEATIELVE